MEKKINLSNCITWGFHRSGWKYVIDNLSKNFHNPLGVRLISHFETTVAVKNSIKIPWIGFLHNAPYHHESMKAYGNFDVSLSDISKSYAWLNSRDSCLGLFVLSNYSKQWITENMFENVCNLNHPTEMPNIKFNADCFFSRKRRSVFFIGHWMRNFASFEKLKCDYSKIMLITPGHQIRKTRKQNSFVTYKDHVSNYNYDILLSKNLVFLDLFDASANNVLIECIVRNNPIVVRRLKSTEEYIGKEYPLLFDSLNEAEEKIADDKTIRLAYEYLVKMDKSFLTIDKFINDFANSKIYSSITI
jgi:hypothetical protein